VTAQDPAVERSSRRTGLYVLTALTAGAYLPSPLYPAYQGALGASDLAMTLIYATFALVSAPALLLLGPASDSFGQRPLLRLGLVASAAGSACFALADGTGWHALGRAAQGLALGAATSAATALIDAASKPLRGPALASTAFLGGTAAGPVVCGLLAEHAPAPRFTPFALHLVVIAVGWRLVSDVPAPAVARTRWRPTRPRIPVGMRVLFTAAALTGFLAWLVAGLFLSVIPALLARSGTGPAATGAVLGAVLICSMLTQPLVLPLGPRRAEVLGLVALLISLVLLALTAASSTTLTLAAAVVAGSGHGLAYGGAATAVQAAPQGQRGAVTGALYLAFYLGSGVPAVCIGLIALGAPLRTATTVVTTAALALVPLAAATVLAPRRRRISRAGAPRRTTRRRRSRRRSAATR
jgi:MFS family permease